MNINDVITLATAGYTAEQINKMAAVQVVPQAVPQAVQQAVPQASKDPFNQLMDAITGQLQAQNIANFNQPKPQTVDEMLTSLVDPPKGGVK